VLWIFCLVFCPFFGEGGESVNIDWTQVINSATFFWMLAIIAFALITIAFRK